MVIRTKRSYNQQIEPPKSTNKHNLPNIIANLGYKDYSTSRISRIKLEMITKDKINEIGKDDYLLLSEIKPSRSHFSLLLFLLSFSLSL
jgi:hypothetical protein